MIQLLGRKRVAKMDLFVAVLSRSLNAHEVSRCRTSKALFSTKVHLWILNLCSIFSMDVPLYNKYMSAF